MYAVIKTGGKQYRVAPDDLIVVEKLAGEPGASIDLEEVLMIGDDDGQTVGAPTIEGARVAATVVEQKRDKKIIIFKKKRRKNYRRKNGHRQDITVLRITDILAAGAKKKAAKKPAAKKPAAEKKSAAKPDAEPAAKPADTSTAKGEAAAKKSEE